MKNRTLYLVILTWLQQLQQCFFEKSEQDPLRDWNKYRWHYSTGTSFISGRPTLSKINMSTGKSETHTPVTDVSYFKPNKERDDVVNLSGRIGSVTIETGYYRYTESCKKR
jgi:hypothetical protein